MKRFAFLYNPTAGAGKSGRKFSTLKRKISAEKGCELFYSSTNGDIAGFVDQRLDDFDVFVACGGDGTIREIASKLISTNKKIGIIPMGTGNDLCKTLNIPRNFSQAFDLVIGGESRKIDVGRCNDFIFLNTLGFGFDGLTNRYASKLKHLHPFLCYAISALKSIVTHSVFNGTVIANGPNITHDLIMFSVANGRVEGASFWIAPDASVTDGKLNCISITPINKWLIPFLLPLFLVKKPYLLPQVSTKKRKKLTLEISGSVDIHADGEVIESQSEHYEIEVIPKALEVICRI